jgi:hypothetical protein
VARRGDRLLVCFERVSLDKIVRGSVAQASPFIFLSHSGADTEAARELRRRLLTSPDAKKAGLKVWFDKDDLKPGTPWSAQLADAIQNNATAFLVYVGSRGVMNWVDAEVELAISRTTNQQAEAAAVHPRPSRRRSRSGSFAALRQTLSGRPRPSGE